MVGFGYTSKVTMTLPVILLLLRWHWVNPNWSQQKLQVKSLTREWSSEKDRLCCPGRGDDALLMTPPSPCASTKLSNLLKSAKSSCFSTLVWLASNLSLLVEFSSLRLGVVGKLLAGGTLSPVYENKYQSRAKSHSCMTHQTHEIPCLSTFLNTERRTENTTENTTRSGVFSVQGVWYIFSIKTKTKKKMEK